MCTQTNGKKPKNIGKFVPGIVKTILQTTCKYFNLWLLLLYIGRMTYIMGPRFFINLICSHLHVIYSIKCTCFSKIQVLLLPCKIFNSLSKLSSFQQLLQPSFLLFNSLKVAWLIWCNNLMKHKMKKEVFLIIRTLEPTVPMASELLCEMIISLINSLNDNINNQHHLSKGITGELTFLFSLKTNSP